LALSAIDLVTLLSSSFVLPEEKHALQYLDLVTQDHLNMNAT
jgi:hypothetical protein